jgi:hypothetical protein
MRIYSRSIFVFLLLISVAVWAADHQAGTWKLNPAKSKGTADRPVNKSLTVTIKDQDGGIVLDAVGEDAKGSPIKVHYSAKFDGKDYPSTGSADGSDTVSLKQIDADTMDSTNKKNGQVTTTIHSVVSKDGKTRTSTWSGKDSKGNPETWTAVFDKQ